MSLKFTLAFGLVSIPIKAEPAARGLSISFNQLSGCCTARTKQNLVCSSCEKPVDRAAMKKGFEVSKDQYLVIDPAELAALKSESDKVIDIEATVPAGQVDPLLFDSSFYVEPEPAGKKAYALITAAFEAEKVYGIGRVTMGGSEQIVIIRPLNGGLTFSTMFYQSEVRPAPALENTPVNPKELAMARKLVQANAADFDHAEYSNKYMASVEDLIERKKAGKPVKSVAVPAARKPVVDIMAALEASLVAKPAKRKKVA